VTVAGAIGITKPLVAWLTTACIEPVMTLRKRLFPVRRYWRISGRADRLQVNARIMLYINSLLMLSLEDSTIGFAAALACGCSLLFEGRQWRHFSGRHGFKR
jgi:hypothetical protein